MRSAGAGLVCEPVVGNDWAMSCLAGAPTAQIRSYVVTGGAGFIGSHLCDRLLADGHRVLAIDDLSTGREANLVRARTYGDRFTFAEMDIRDPGLRDLFDPNGPEVVMHLAANSGVRPSVKDPRFDASVNIDGLLSVLDACTSVGARKVVFAASGGTLYGEPDPDALPLSETAISAGEPVSPYGITKKAALGYLRFYATVRGLDFTALALGNVFGPRQDPLGEAGVVAIFAERLLKGEAPIVFGDGRQTRDYVFVDDVVDAFVRASDRASGEVLNIGTGIETSVMDILRGLAAAAGWTGEPGHGPLPDGELRRICLDASAAASHLGWRASTPLGDGLGLTVEHLKGAG